MYVTHCMHVWCSLNPKVINVKVNPKVKACSLFDSITNRYNTYVMLYAIPISFMIIILNIKSWQAGSSSWTDAASLLIRRKIRTGK